jgi:hypothetical protein
MSTFNVEYAPGEPGVEMLSRATVYADYVVAMEHDYAFYNDGDEPEEARLVCLTPRSRVLQVYRMPTDKTV